MFDEKIKKEVTKKLNLKKWFTTEEIDNFFQVSQKYVIKKKFSKKMFEINIDKTISLLKDLQFSKKDISLCIVNNPSILFMNKMDLLAKYLVLGLVKSNDDFSLRDHVLINHSKYYIIGIRTLYARGMYLKSLNEDKNYLKKWYILKMTNQEFTNYFEISTTDLYKRYEYNPSLIASMLQWPENLHLKNTLKDSY